MSGEIDSPRVRLELTSRPESARLVRSMSTAAGEALGFDPELLSDVNTAVWMNMRTFCRSESARLISAPELIASWKPKPTR